MLQGPAGIVHPGGAKHPHEVAQRQLRQRQRRRQLQQAAGRLIALECLYFLLSFSHHTTLIVHYR